MKQHICDRLEPRRLLSAGELDTAFGDAGQAALPSVNGQWNALATLADGSFLVVGETDRASNHQRFAPADVLVARYNPKGQLDPTFGQQGLAVIDLGGQDTGQQVIVRPDGRIVIGARISGMEATLRLTPSGALDSRFGTHGIVRGFFAEATQSNGDLIGVSGSQLQRRSPHGVLDASFAQNGAFDLAPRTRHVVISSNVSVGVEPDDKIVAAYSVYNSMTSDNAQLRVIRLNPDGSADVGFGARGMASTLMSFSNDTEVNSSPDGSLYVGVDNSSDGYSATVFKLDRNGNVADIRELGGAIQLAFAADGKIAANLGSRVQQLLPDESPDLRFDGGDAFTLDSDAGGYVNRVAYQAVTDEILAVGSRDFETHPVVYRVTTRDDGSAIQRFSHGTVVIYGTHAADHISSTRTLSSFTFTINGLSKTFQRAHVQRIRVIGDAGNDTITIDGRRTDISIDAGDGDDTVKIVSGNDAFVSGGNGNDFIDGSAIDPPFTGGLYAAGGPGNDHIIGSRFGDNLSGNSGNDTLEGGAANDGLYGGGGDDLLIGGTTGDIMNGDDGNDTLVIDSPGDSAGGGKGTNTYLARDGRAETIFGGGNHSFAQIDDTDKVRDRLIGNFTLIP